jgi:hypothetical protein
MYIHTCVVQGKNKNYRKREGERERGRERGREGEREGDGRKRNYQIKSGIHYVPWY